MQHGTKSRSSENEVWDGLYGRMRNDEGAAALFVQLAEKDAGLRTDRSALFVQASLTVADAQRRLERAERVGRVVGLAFRWPFLASGRALRFAAAALRGARKPESVPSPGPLPQDLIDDPQLMGLLLEKARSNPVLRERMIGLVQADIIARIEASQSQERRAA